MFEISEEGQNAKPLRMASWPVNKFFNYMENPFTSQIDLDNIVEISEKRDGSLISSYTIDDKVYLKTKGALESDQAIAATKWLYKPLNKPFLREIRATERLNYTVIMEWTSETNRVVLKYQESTLTVLAIRSNIDGHYVHLSDVDVDVFPKIYQKWTKTYSTDNSKAFVELIPDMHDIEGFVCRTKDNLLFKVKTNQYLTLHKNKDNINTPKKLYHAVVYETSDDLRSLFFDDPFSLNLINEMEEHVGKQFNHVVDTVERFYERNKNLTRKDYAILGQQELINGTFSLAMNLFLEKENDYKEFMVKQYDNYRLPEVDIQEDE